MNDDKVNELLDELASLAVYWKDWRDDAGTVPRGIRAGMLDTISEIVAELGKEVTP